MKLEKFGIALSLVCGTLLGGCKDDLNAYKKVSPVKIDQIDGQEIKRITLTPEAMQRIDLQTAVVRETQVQGWVQGNGQTSGQSSVVRKVVPYGSLIYDEYGKTWVYARASERSFERKPVEVDYIEGDNAVLADGPPNDTEIATSGAAELYGVEGGIGGAKK
jgi:hypothetical protein